MIENVAAPLAAPLPCVLIGGWLGAGFVPLLFTCTAFSVIMTWVYNNTRGSVLLMVLLHASANAAISVGGRVLPADLPAGLSALVYGGWIPVITYTVLALVILVATRGRLSYPPVEESSAAFMAPQPKPSLPN